MKKIIGLCASVIAALALSTATPVFAKQKFDIPNYDYKNFENAKAKKVEHFGLVRGATLLIPLDKEELKEYLETNSPVAEETSYGFDRNNDGRIDLIYSILKVPNAESTKSKTGYLDYAMFEEADGPVSECHYLKIDDDLNGYANRVLIDDEHTDKILGADGEYDRETIIDENDKRNSDMEQFFRE